MLWSGVCVVRFVLGYVFSSFTISSSVSPRPPVLVTSSEYQKLIFQDHGAATGKRL